MTNSYSIHGLIEVESNVAVPVPEYFATDEVTEPDITVVERDFDVDRSSLRRKKRKDYTVWVGDSSVVFDYEFLDLKLRLSDLDSQTVVEFTPRMWRFSDDSIRSLIEDLLQFKLLDRGYTFLHAAGITCNDELILLPAIGTTGKTYTSISLVDGDSRYIMSDDRVILGEDGTVYCYPKTVNTGPYVLQNDAVPELSVNPRITSYLANIPFFSILFGKFFWLYPSKSEPIPDRLIVDEASPTYAFTFSAGDDDEPVSIDADEMLRRCMVQHYDTFVPFSNYILNYTSFLLDYDLTSTIDQSRDIVGNVLSGVDCYDVRHGDPEEYPKQILEAVRK